VISCALIPWKNITEWINDWMNEKKSCVNIFSHIKHVHSALYEMELIYWRRHVQHYNCFSSFILSKYCFPSIQFIDRFLFSGETVGPVWKPENGRVSGNRVLHHVRSAMPAPPIQWARSNLVEHCCLKHCFYVCNHFVSLFCVLGARTVQWNLWITNICEMRTSCEIRTLHHNWSQNNFLTAVYTLQ
jgi:hypothetical protein